MKSLISQRSGLRWPLGPGGLTGARDHGLTRGPISDSLVYKGTACSFFHSCAIGDLS